MSDWACTSNLRTQFRAKLQSFEALYCEDVGLTSAAVALVVVSAGAEAAVLLTLRTSRLGRHAGQFALPGGRVDAQEHAEQAARRELHEELGVDLDERALIGRLDDYPTRSGFCISPFVYWATEPLELRPSADEVEQVYRIPLSELDSDAIPLFEAGVDARRPVVYSDFPSVGCTMYSPTAALLYQFREVLLRGQHTRVAHFDQPAFAWQ